MAHEQRGERGPERNEHTAQRLGHRRLRSGRVHASHEKFVDKKKMHHHEAAEVCREERRRQKSQEFSDDRDFQHGVEADDRALGPEQQHHARQIPVKEQHARQRNEIRAD